MNKPKARPPLPQAHDLEPGLVVATYGRHCLVETPEGRRLICHPRGKKNQVVVGDQVLWQIAGDEGSKVARAVRQMVVSIARVSQGDLMSRRLQLQ